MRVLHSATRFLAVLGLALAAGCSSESTAPNAPFSAEGTSDDVGAVGESFQAPAIDAYMAASMHVDLVVGGPAELALHAMPSAAIARDGQQGALRFATSLASRYRTSGMRPSLSTAAIPAEYLGVTFAWDVATDTYVASDLTGAPGNGVRFLLYAVNPVTQMPVEPLVELGHVDLTGSETATSATARAVVVSGGVTYLDYTAVMVASSGSSATLAITGYATNGTDRVDFDLDNEITISEATGIGVVIDYLLVVPTRGGFRMDVEAAYSGYLTDTPSVTLDLTARGDHGTVNIQGTATDATGSFDVAVNGELFATITFDGEGLPVVTGATGQPLTEAEQAALLGIWYVFDEGLAFFNELSPML